MAGFRDASVHAMLDLELPAGSASLSLHSGDPGSTGANEISGGSPAYARKTVTRRAILTREQRQELLTQFANNDGIEPKDRIKAIEVLGKMQGDFIERREVEHRGAAVSFVFEDNGRGPAPQD